MKRGAVIIGNEGIKGTKGYLAGVAKDIANYQSFLEDAIGGYWYAAEIKAMMRPSVAQVRQELKQLSNCDYGLVVFAGHGWHSTGTRSTALQLREGEEIDSDELRRGAPKQTLILDCCRTPSPEIPISITEARKLAKALPTIDPQKCRRLYENVIERCANGLVVMHACNIGETAGDDEEKGGYYSYSLIEETRGWAKEVTFDSRGVCGSVVGAHEIASPRVQRISGNRQNPIIEKPRTERHFPFCIVA